MKMSNGVKIPRSVKKKCEEYKQALSIATTLNEIDSIYDDAVNYTMPYSFEVRLWFITQIGQFIENNKLISER